MDSSSYYPDKFKKVDETVSSVIEERGTLRAEVERLKSELGKWTRKHDDADLEEMRQQAQCLSLAAKVAYINALEHHLMHSKSDLAAAVEVLRKFKTDWEHINWELIIKMRNEAVALLARMEVRP